MTVFEKIEAQQKGKEKIEAQQKGKENTAAWMVGEQLKDICRADPHCAEIVAQDLENASMSLAQAEKQIKAFADKQSRTGNCVCVPPNAAERILREFYGLPEKEAAPSTDVPTFAPGFLSLDDLLD